MTPTKEQQAQEYAEKIAEGLFKNPWVDPQKEVTAKFKQAYSDGYTACEQSMWHSVEEELPSPDTMCLVFGYQDLDFNGSLTPYTMMAWYDGENFYDAYNDRKYHPEKWMAIPLPDTNTEKK